MNILAIVRAAALKLDLEVPSVLFSSTERTWLEMQETVNTAALQIQNDYNWSTLIRTAVLTGDGTETAFPLPDDYSHMVDDAELVGPNWRFYPTQQIQNFTYWLELQSQPIETWQQAWMAFGGNLNLMPVLPAGEVLRYGYITTNIVIGQDPTRFTMDTDKFVLDDELLKLSIIWNWKSDKGFDFSAELAKYQERLESLRFVDVGSRQSIRTNGRRWGGIWAPGGFV